VPFGRRALLARGERASRYSRALSLVPEILLLTPLVVVGSCARGTGKTCPYEWKVISLLAHGWPWARRQRVVDMRRGERRIDTQRDFALSDETQGGQSRAAVLVAEDDADFRHFLVTLLEEAGYAVVEAATGREAVDVARAARPRVALLDIQLPDLNGYEVCRALRDDFGNQIAIAFVSGTRTETLDRSAGLLIGGDDYIVKPISPEELRARVQALLRRVAAGQAGTAGEQPFGLTPRELDVLDLLARGLAQDEIASNLFITPKTVGRHIEHILAKLGVHSRAEAVGIAYRRGLVNNSFWRR
jgi:DNA-binding NarL/FixJ family response regulator